MREVMIALEAFGIMVALVVLYGNIFEVHNKKKRDRNYTISVVLVIIVQFVDMAAWWLMGQTDYVYLLWGLHVTRHLLVCAVAVYFVYYLWTLINESHPLPKWSSVCMVSFSGPTMLVILYFAIKGRIFHLEEGYYIPEDLHYVTLIYLAYTLVWAIMLILYNATYLGRRKILATISYILLPAFALVWQYFHPYASLLYIAFSYSMLIVYVILQAEHEMEYHSRETSLIEASTRDSLTGLYNRRAYDMACNQMKKFEKVGIIFCDANGLKHTNDAFGHQAGDKLLLQVSNGLIDIFSRNQVFRISGDEFVVMCPNMTYENFHAQGISLRAFIRRSGMPIASVGEAYGEGADVYQLIKQAEQQMYQDKESFYNQYPSMERRNR